MTTEKKDIDTQATVTTVATEAATVSETAAAAEETTATQSLQEVIKEQAKEEDAPFTAHLTLPKILCGDILNTTAVKRQIWLCLLVVVFIIIYISNRYNAQQKLIEIDKLQKELQDAKYKALSTSSQLTEKSRESNVLDMLKATNDSTLHIANQPPFIISVPEK